MATSSKTVGYVGYVRGLPKSVPSGRVLVHNHVRHSATTRCGVNGFRAWLQAPENGLIRCDCGWARLPHYRVNVDADGNRLNVPIVHDIEPR